MLDNRRNPIQIEHHWFRIIEAPKHKPLRPPLKPHKKYPQLKNHRISPPHHPNTDRSPHKDRLKEPLLYSPAEKRARKEVSERESERAQRIRFWYAGGAQLRPLVWNYSPGNRSASLYILTLPHTPWIFSNFPRGHLGYRASQWVARITRRKPLSDLQCEIALCTRL